MDPFPPLWTDMVFSGTPSPLRCPHGLWMPPYIMYLYYHLLCILYYFTDPIHMVMPTGNCLVIALVLATSTFSLIIGEDVDNNDENIIPDNMPYPLPGRLVRRNFLRFGKRDHS